MMKMRYAALVGVVALAGWTSVVEGQNAGPDWTQWRGPNRDGSLASFSEPKAWPETLTQRWKLDVGLGYATPLVVGNRVFAFSRQGENEVMRALDAASGKIVWETSYNASFKMNPATARHGAGPKSTPAFADGRLFALGMTGMVTAFDANTGKQLWQKPAPPVEPLYHTSMSPLVDRGLVILHVGGHNQGALTAFDAATGNVRWSWNGDGPAYGSPIIAQIGGTRQVIVFSQKNLVGVDAATGALLWSTPFESRSTTNSITPLVYGDTVIVSGQGMPVSAYRIGQSGGKWITDVAWTNDRSRIRCSSATRSSRCLPSTAASSSGSTPSRARRSGPPSRGRRVRRRSCGPGICCSC
jgi:outer membrane protein assembly factor BamB